MHTFQPLLQHMLAPELAPREVTSTSRPDVARGTIHITTDSPGTLASAQSMLLRRLCCLWPDQALDGADPLLEANLDRRAPKLASSRSTRRTKSPPPPVGSLLTASSHRDTRRASATSSASIY